MGRRDTRRKERPVARAKIDGGGGIGSELDLYYEHWRALTPAERLRRSWRMRSRLPDPEAVHDAKLFPRP